MLNKDRIRLMTQLAAYEQNEGKEYMPMSQYYRKDYVGLQMIKTFFCSTIAFCILFLLHILYELDAWMEELYQMDYQTYMIDILLKYIVFVLVYQVIAWIVYSLRYQKGHKSQKQYHNKLKRVEKLYEREEKQLPLEEWND